MTNITGAIMVPHPPLILPNIGRGEEKKISDIVQAYEQAGKMIVDSKPDTVVIISPHAPSYYDYIQISDGAYGKGSMAQFGDYADSFTIPYDRELIQEMSRLADLEGLPTGTLGQQDGQLDHGTMVPLYFLRDLPKDTKFVRMSIGGPSNLVHYQVGELIAKAANNLGRKVAVVGSGDLSHCQKAGTNYGFKPCGPAYDKKIMEIMGDADFESLLALTDKEADDAMVCGQKPFCVMAGALDGLNPKTDRLAHSAEFGVGYGVVTYENPVEDASRDFGEKEEARRLEAAREKFEKEDELVKLADLAIREAVENQSRLEIPESIDPELLKQRAGAFVSIHKNHDLRGCIGTTAPTQANLAEEIISNGISAALRDPRFPAIQPWELDDLEINVDVLGEPEPISSEDELDVKKYGVIVTKGRNRGLLLPDLEGVDTVEKQVAIAKQKAGLSPDEKGVSLERFEVVRHR